MIIYTFPGTRGIRVTWAAEELKLPYEITLVNLKRGEHKQSEYLSINPEGKIPAIKIDDYYMSESGAILTYLGDRYQRLIPLAGTAERAQYEQMMSFILTELEQPLWTIAKHKFALPEDLRVPEIVPTACWEFKNALSIFATLLGDNEYLLPTGFSLVDIVAAQTLSWAKGAKQEVEDPRVNEYAKRALVRSALANAKAKEEEALTNAQ